MTDQIWTLLRDDGPLVATAIHAGHAVRPEVEALMAIDEEGRLREEDPFTDVWTSVAPTQVIGLRSRFEVDLNRPRERAVYMTPDQAWGLRVWENSIPEEILARSMAQRDLFYDAMRTLFESMAREHGRFIVLDLHSYNHRRGGPEAPPAAPEENPDIIIGTRTMTDRSRWAGIIDRLIADLRAFDFPTGRIDVRENVKFGGGNFAHWTHTEFPESAGVISFEFKKIFMDEWTGVPDPLWLEAIGEALRRCVPGILEEIRSA
ncbi:N-formylglutamate amidohydrolase [Candidatus Sumerlaeota bacterium]|nr:N-formylglutamate amidohydrolase [Candidatus Sumerlaeota bacterium]